MDAASSSTPPVECTLTTRELVAQRLEWSDLVPLAESRRAIDGGVASSYPLHLAGQIEELAARETSCCGSWLSITHERTATSFQLRLTTSNSEGVGLIRSMSGVTD